MMSINFVVSIISEYSNWQGTEAFCWEMNCLGLQNRPKNFDTGTDFLYNQNRYIICGRITAIFTSQSARVVMKFGVRILWTALLNYVSFNHMVHDISYNLIWLKICWLLLCWSHEYMKLRNLVLLQLDLGPYKLEEVYCKD